MKASDLKRYQSKSYQALEKLAVKHFNAWIRHRDIQEVQGGFICISCGELKPIAKMHAGHFFSAGHYPITRFDEDNVHGQCHRCNRHLHGNLLHYRERLERKIGTLKLNNLERKAQMRGGRIDRWTLIELIIQYKNKLSHDEKNQNNDGSSADGHLPKRRMHFQ